MAGILMQGDGVTDEQRAMFARQVAERGRETASARKTFLHALGGDSKIKQASRITGAILEDRVIPAGGYWSGRVKRAEHLRIIDLEGREAVDFLCFDANNPHDRYNAANTVKVNKSVYLGLGTAFYSEHGNRMLTIVEDTVGFHDTIGGCCSAEMNYIRYGIPDTPNCHSNFTLALNALGLDALDIVANVNFFMYVPVRPDGATELIEGASVPGDFVDVRADMDLVCAI